MLMDDAQANQVMARFGKAFFSRDPDQIAQVITDNAQWHFAIGSDAPNGRVRSGVAGFLQGIGENDALFEQLKFLDVNCRALGSDQIVMTYLVQGKYRNGVDFSLRGIELITVNAGKIALKDVFWKQGDCSESNSAPNPFGMLAHRAKRISSTQMAAAKREYMKQRNVERNES